jgi:hypothetical protein
VSLEVVRFAFPVQFGGGLAPQLSGLLIRMKGSKAFQSLEVDYLC